MITASATYKLFKRKYLDRVFSKEDLNDTMKIVKSLEESGLLIKGVSKK